MKTVKGVGIQLPVIDREYQGCTCQQGQLSKTTPNRGATTVALNRIFQ